MVVNSGSTKYRYIIFPVISRLSSRSCFTCPPIIPTGDFIWNEGIGENLFKLDFTEENCIERIMVKGA